jgi:hypothetical protein
MSTLTFVLLTAAIGALVLIPTRRLFLAGWSSQALAAYFLIVVALGFFVAELRGPARYLIPIFVLAYIAPFVTARDGVARLRERFGRPAPGAPGERAGAGTEPGREPRNVTPPDERPGAPPR